MSSKASYNTAYQAWFRAEKALAKATEAHAAKLAEIDARLLAIPGVEELLKEKAEIAERNKELLLEKAEAEKAARAQLIEALCKYRKEEGLEVQTFPFKTWTITLVRSNKLIPGTTDDERDAAVRSVIENLPRNIGRYLAPTPAAEDAVLALSGVTKTPDGLHGVEEANTKIAKTFPGWKLIENFTLRKSLNQKK